MFLKEGRLTSISLMSIGYFTEYVFNLSIYQDHKKYRLKSKLFHPNRVFSKDNLQENVL